ncbi:UDP-N-acetylmuramoyl-L-alanyl-D-glutamate--2,6-diaminopimelate ligase MurE [Moraxella macacae 0408225]|uniref:UDP-N-acetylmuramoyl-L-alanyl-D-glutamate--2,6-diaminopimelate ligase n=2 Tax=Pseudomonadota TaxID=1224 RepID=L2F8W7_9GAMM|nr:UDP-N-acetylmuramoyl-L-alanyl-D-glutamate--2,6-diaminopimelate ligase [Moraxella macacae]ELA09350.1 UDP-N-acetylmuramoyl-L-alanyl-D-glutamate--2,6-diaminopimelate ligase MurE [Moraxella macacae 0408225]
MQLQQFNLTDDLKKTLNSVLKIDFKSLQVDSRKLACGDVFVLLKSQNPNATTDLDSIKIYLNSAKDKCAFVLSEIDVSDIVNESDKVIYLPTIRKFLGDLICQSLQFDCPAKLPSIIAVTGTNGKTTVSQLVAQLIFFGGQTVGVMGTAGNGVMSKGVLKLKPATHTTMEVFNLHHAVHDVAKAGVQFLSIEASSHGLHQHRLQGLPIQVAIFTNLSRDHLDYHENMDDYVHAKTRLFDKNLFLQLTHAIINLDDKMSEEFIHTAKESNLNVWTYSLNDDKADFFAKTMTPSLDGVDLTVVTPFGEMCFKSPLLGRFNVANLLASIGAAMAIGMPFDTVKSAIEQLKGATGRMDKVASKAGAFIVDYAHTPDALEQVLTSLKGHCKGDLWVVFGCGGDRDKGKRPLMTQVALKLADKVVLTADNPRTENPLAILKDMQEGMTCNEHYKTQIEPDRKTAIEFAVKNSRADDIVVIAGKGHETYQEINGVRYDFDDSVVLKEAIERFGK